MQEGQEVTLVSMENSSEQQKQGVVTGIGRNFVCVTVQNTGNWLPKETHIHFQLSKSTNRWEYGQLYLQF